MYPNSVQCQETGRQYPRAAGPLQDHTGKKADVEIREDSADKKEDSSGLFSRHKRSFPLAMDQTRLPTDTGRRLVLGAMKLAVFTLLRDKITMRYVYSLTGRQWTILVAYPTWFPSFPILHIDVPRTMSETGVFTLTDRSLQSKEPLQEPCVPPGHVHDHMYCVLQEEKHSVHRRQGSRSRFMRNGGSENVHEA